MNEMWYFYCCPIQSTATCLQSFFSAFLPERCPTSTLSKRSFSFLLLFFSPFSKNFSYYSLKHQRNIQRIKGWAFNIVQPILTGERDGFVFSYFSLSIQIILISHQNCSWLMIAMPKFWTRYLSISYIQVRVLRRDYREVRSKTIRMPCAPLIGRDNTCSSWMWLCEIVLVQQCPIFATCIFGHRRGWFWFSRWGERYKINSNGVVKSFGKLIFTEASEYAWLADPWIANYKQL